MAQIQVSTGDAQSFDRRPVERELRARRDEPYRQPLCRAPSTMLVVDRDGGCRGCPQGRLVLADARTNGIAAAFTGTELTRLRDLLQQDRLHAGHCVPCIQRLASGQAHLSPLVREHGQLPAVEVEQGGPARLHLRLDGHMDPHADEELLLTLEAAAPHCEQVLVELRPDVTDGLLDPYVARVLSTLAAAEPSPQVLLRLSSLPEDGAELLARLQLCRLELQVGPGLHRSLPIAEALAKARNIPLELMFLVSPDNWYEAPHVARLAAASAATMKLRVVDDGGNAPMAGLSLPELHALHGEFATWWSQMSGADRPSSLPPREYEEFMTELLDLVEQIGKRHVYQDPQQVLKDSGVRFALPELDHALFADSDTSISVIKGLLWMAHSPSVLAWTRNQAKRPGALEAARSRPWLRLLYQKVAVEDPDLKVRDLLRQVYARPRERDRLLKEEKRLCARVGVESFAASLSHELGLDRSLRRSRPFKFKPKEVGPDPIEPRITVLVPSFRHEDFVTEALQSVLAQTEMSLRLLVVDDRSPDQTVAKASMLKDPRLEVVVNANNLGLGNSVLAALDRVTTPYLALLNSDDLFHPERLARCLEVLDQEPGCELVTTGFVLVDGEGDRLTPQNVSQLLDTRRVHDLVHWFENATPTEASKDSLFLELMQRNFLATSSNLVCRTSFLRAEAESLRSLKYCLDWQLFLTAARNRSLRHLPEPLLAYRLHGSNTVWFQEGQRWSYTLEVNRVAARALREWVAGLPAGGQRLRHAVHGVVQYLRRNSELDGYGLMLHALLDDLELDRESAAQVEVRADVELMASQLLEDRRAISAAASLGNDAQTVLAELWRIPQWKVLAVLHDVHRTKADVATGTATWLRNYVDELEERLHQTWQAEQSLQRQLSSANETLHALEQERDRFKTEHDQQQVMLLHLQTIEATLRDERATLRSMLSILQDEHSALVNERAILAAERDQLAGIQEQTTHELARLVESLRITTEEANRLREDLGSEQLARANITAERDRQQRRADDLDRVLADTRAAWLDEVRRIHRSREWRYGNFFWNKLPLTATSARILKGMYRRSLDFKERVRIVLRRVLGRRRRSTRWTGIVAATGRFPVYSHTFVYQEMISLREMGVDPLLFYWIKEDPALLAPAYRYLLDNSVQLQSVRETHLADMAHWQKTRPQKLESLLERISAITGRSKAELEDTYEIQQACTFARMVEHYRPDYLHSYFFYEQSLFALFAGWLLDIPRGVSTYADHMMTDWPFKLVALHLEQADVIVATSNRIKQELISIGGAVFADKIVVKPNGVDGTVFLPQPRTETVADWFDVVSVSRIEPKKGLLTLPEAARLLKDRGHRVRFRIVGTVDQDNPGNVQYEERLRARIAELDVGECMVFEGFKRQEELIPLHAVCHAFVASYVETANGDKDGIPTALLEAMATGLPVLVTDAGSIPEVVQDGVEGMMFSQHDAEGLAARIEQLLADPKRRLEMGYSARKRFEQEFATQVTERRLHERIQQVLKKRHNGKKTKP